MARKRCWDGLEALVFTAPWEPLRIWGCRCYGISDYLHRIFWRPGADFRITDSHRRFGSGRPDGWSHLHGSPAERLLHELDGQPERRGHRIASAGAGHGRGAVVARGGSVLAGPGVGEVNCAA